MQIHPALRGATINIGGVTGKPCTNYNLVLAKRKATCGRFAARVAHLSDAGCPMKEAAYLAADQAEADAVEAADAAWEEYEKCREAAYGF